MKKLIIVSVFILGGLFAQVDYDTQIQPIWTSNCTNCHTSTHGSGLNLTSGNSYNNLVDVVSQNYAPALLVASGDPSSSVLYDKISNSGTYGQVMPPSGQMSASNISLVETWINELGSTTITIAAARALAIGSSATVQGIVTSPNWGGYYTSYTIQDSTAGIIVYASASTIDPPATLALGDKVEVTGTIDEYNGLMEIVPSGEDDITILSSGNDTPDAQEVTVATLLTDGEDYESEIIVIDNVSITSGTWPGEGSSANLTISDDNETSTITMRIDSDTDIDGQTQPQSPFIVTAVIGQYNDYQVQPRYYTDFVAVGAVVPTIVIISPADGGVEYSEDVDVVFDVSNFTIGSPGTGADGHIHYTVDASGIIIHDTTDPISLTGLANGSYTVEVWLVDDTHNDLNPFVGDTVNFTVNVSTSTVTEIFPTEFSISDAYPNPFNPVTAIDISIPKESKITIVVHDLLGRRLLKIEKNFTRAGNYQFVWSGKNASGENVTSGVYLISVQYDNKNIIKKVTLLK
jgi:DNA/RNA endonuclease YhcR with UshA esterase domain